MTTLDDSIAGRTPTHTTITVERATEAAILLVDASATDATLRLNNGSGYNYDGALVLESFGSPGPRNTLRGDLHLGDVGAHIGGSGSLRMEGQIFGGSLKLGRSGKLPRLFAVGGALEYTGATEIYSGQLVLSESGRLEHTSSIEISRGGAVIPGFSAERRCYW
ncbi:MAG: hypothetical protein R3E01_21830 [Pirellulaceae bacterium]|nr:hypothetical protein [Planctomycetales bacterium]